VTADGAAVNKYSPIYFWISAALHSQNCASLNLTAWAWHIWRTVTYAHSVFYWTWIIVICNCRCALTKLNCCWWIKITCCLLRSAPVNFCCSYYTDCVWPLNKQTHTSFTVHAVLTVVHKTRQFTKRNTRYNATGGYDICSYCMSQYRRAYTRF